MNKITRLNFAWEILRRIPDYQVDYYASKARDDTNRSSNALKWGLLRFL